MLKFIRSKFKLWVYLTFVSSKYLCRPVYVSYNLENLQNEESFNNLSTVKRLLIS